ncbi:hypothetical protein C8R46DRAFT_1094341 [Mycena filopes]|nr:hypothetical protein C8R46DRAFT_1094341 [Mycena filopes]
MEWLWSYCLVALPFAVASVITSTLKSDFPTPSFYPARDPPTLPPIPQRTHRINRQSNERTNDETNGADWKYCNILLSQRTFGHYSLDSLAHHHPTHLSLPLNSTPTLVPSRYQSIQIEIKPKRLHSYDTLYLFFLPLPIRVFPSVPTINPRYAPHLRTVYAQSTIYPSCFASSPTTTTFFQLRLRMITSTTPFWFSRTASYSYYDSDCLDRITFSLSLSSPLLSEYSIHPPSKSIEATYPRLVSNHVLVF